MVISEVRFSRVASSSVCLAGLALSSVMGKTLCVLVFLLCEHPLTDGTDDFLRAFNVLRDLSIILHILVNQM